MIKLPRTLHIEGSRMPHGKVDPEAQPFNKLNGEFMVIEEKVDGTGVCLFWDHNLEPQIWHRGNPAIGKEYKLLHEWVNLHYNELFDLLNDRYMLFGEWMYNKHTIFYDRLPGYFLESDIYDKNNNIWLSTLARDSLLSGKQYIKRVPVLAAGKFNRLDQLTNLVGKPTFQSDRWREALWSRCEMLNYDLHKALEETDSSNLMEGLYIKHENDGEVLKRYKFVRYEFINTIINSGTHLIDREPISNGVMGGYNHYLK